jgi:glucosamine--fructose-6-phosphate aminotransferase (isomerizing)
MCGIVGYVGDRPCRDLLIAGLEKLEYRGYDSAGISVLSDGEIDSVRAVGNLANLRAAVEEQSSNGDAGSVAVAAKQGTIGLGHTRWATHGRVTEENAHPHGDCEDKIHIVLNGIVENHAELRRELVSEGHEFTSETDAEIVAHLIERHYEGDLTEAVRKAFGDLRGHYAFVAMHNDHGDTLVAARKECPLIVGLGEDENFVASAIPAFLAETRRALGIKNDELVTVHKGDVTVMNSDGTLVEDREPLEVTWDEDAAEKDGYATFMLKEIHQQPDAVAETITDRLPNLDGVDLSDVDLDDDFLKGIERIVIVACGTSYHAGLVGRYAIEQWARVPVEMDIASEYRYREPVHRPNDLVIGITQSETADTLAAMRLAREGGSKVLAICNVMGSQATQEADAVLYTRSGIEVSVAATKTFVCQVAAVYLLGLRLAELRGTMERERISELVAELKSLPHKIQETIVSCDERVKAIARSLHDQRFFMYIGRHIGLAVCLEGALKLKEISYIPADAYAAGEMKHGPIALLDESTPVVAVATDSPVVEKILSNMEEVRARGADVVAVATEGGHVGVEDAADQTIFVPRTDWILQPIVAIVPLQLLAYYIARENGLNVDQPRNLAKTVTVE